jgi:hypothetical protein
MGIYVLEQMKLVGNGHGVATFLDLVPPNLHLAGRPIHKILEILALMPTGVGNVGDTCFAMEEVGGDQALLLEPVALLLPGPEEVGLEDGVEAVLDDGGKHLRGLGLDDGGADQAIVVYFGQIYKLFLIYEGGFPEGFYLDVIFGVTGDITGLEIVFPEDFVGGVELGFVEGAALFDGEAAEHFAALFTEGVGHLVGHGIGFGAGALAVGEYVQIADVQLVEKAIGFEEVFF